MFCIWEGERENREGVALLVVQLFKFHGRYGEGWVSQPKICAGTTFPVDFEALPFSPPLPISTSLLDT
jgi:hypothetical protein